MLLFLTIVTVQETETHVLSHLSTHYCASMEPLIPLEMSPCQTIPPPRTLNSCETINNDPSMSLTTLFHIIKLMIVQLTS